MISVFRNKNNSSLRSSSTITSVLIPSGLLSRAMEASSCGLTDPRQSTLTLLARIFPCWEIILLSVGTSIVALGQRARISKWEDVTGTTIFSYCGGTQILEVYKHSFQPTTIALPPQPIVITSSTTIVCGRNQTDRTTTME